MVYNLGSFIDKLDGINSLLSNYPESLESKQTKDNLENIAFSILQDWDYIEKWVLKDYNIQKLQHVNAQLDLINAQFNNIINDKVFHANNDLSKHRSSALEETIIKISHINHKIQSHINQIAASKYLTRLPVDKNNYIMLENMPRVMPSQLHGVASSNLPDANSSYIRLEKKPRIMPSQLHGVASSNSPDANSSYIRLEKKPRVMPSQLHGVASSNLPGVNSSYILDEKSPRVMPSQLHGVASSNLLGKNSHYITSVEKNKGLPVSPPDAGYYGSIADYDSEIEDSVIESDEDNETDAESDIRSADSQQRSVAEIQNTIQNIINQAIHIDINTLVMQGKIDHLHHLMPKLEREEITQMVRFVEALKKNPKIKNKTLYLRKEWTGLPLSLLVTKEGKCLWQLKRKAQFKPFYLANSFIKKIQHCLEYDHMAKCISGTIKYNPEIIDLNTSLLNTNFRRGKSQEEQEIINREFFTIHSILQENIYGNKFRGKNNVAQLLWSYFYKSRAWKGPENSDIELLNNDKIIFIYKNYPKGDLRHNISANLTENQKNQIVQDIIRGVYSIHKERILHGDLKVDNIFIDDQFHAHVGDFGCCHEFHCLPALKQGFNYRHPALFENELNKRYLESPDDPEIIKIKQQADIFAMGLALAQMELNQKRLPWENAHDTKQTAKIKMEAFYHNFPENTPRHKLIKRLINPDIHQIPLMSEVKELYS